MSVKPELKAASSNRVKGVWGNVCVFELFYGKEKSVCRVSSMMKCGCVDEPAGAYG